MSTSTSCYHPCLGYVDFNEIVAFVFYSFLFVHAECFLSFNFFMMFELSLREA